MFIIFNVILAVVVIGYNPVPCRVNEGDEGLVIQVEILFGLLGTNLSVQFETRSGSATGMCICECKDFIHLFFEL